MNDEHRKTLPVVVTAHAVQRYRERVFGSVLASRYEIIGKLQQVVRTGLNVGKAARKRWRLSGVELHRASGDRLVESADGSIVLPYRVASGTIIVLTVWTRKAAIVSKGCFRHGKCP